MPLNSNALGQVKRGREGGATGKHDDGPRRVAREPTSEDTLPAKPRVANKEEADAVTLVKGGV